MAIRVAGDANGVVIVRGDWHGAELIAADVMVGATLALTLERRPQRTGDRGGVAAVVGGGSHQKCGLLERARSMGTAVDPHADQSHPLRQVEVVFRVGRCRDAVEANHRSSNWSVESHAGKQWQEESHKGGHGGTPSRSARTLLNRMVTAAKLASIIRAISPVSTACKLSEFQGP